MLKPWATDQIRILDLIRSEHTDDEVSNLSFSRQTARNGYVFEFSFFGSNVSPFFQTLSNGGNLARQRQPRHLGPHPVLSRYFNCLKLLADSEIRLERQLGQS